MNRWEQNAMAGCEEMRGSVSVPLSVSDGKGLVVCPKPRRVGFLANHPPMALRWIKRSVHGEQLDSKAGAELLDLILTKDGYGVEQKDVASSPPPFFTGSPPTRVSNPLVQDANFREEKLSPLSTLQMLPSSSSPSPSASPRKGGCARMKFTLKPAPVRVEGFDCLSRDRQNSGITAVA